MRDVATRPPSSRASSARRLPAVHAEFPGITVDAFCEQGAWSLSDCRRLLEAAGALGHPVRLHADQFHRLGGLDLAIELGARSVDHLEASTPADLARLARSKVSGVVLPATGFPHRRPLRRCARAAGRGRPLRPGHQLQPGIVADLVDAVRDRARAPPACA